MKYLIKAVEILIAIALAGLILKWLSWKILVGLILLRFFFRVDWVMFSSRTFERHGRRRFHE
jgi:hypothetical protein